MVKHAIWAESWGALGRLERFSYLHFRDFVPRDVLQGNTISSEPGSRAMALQREGPVVGHRAEPEDPARNWCSQAS